MTKPKPAKRPKPVRAWAAFSDGKMLKSRDYWYDAMQFWIFTTRREARQAAEDVRRVEIREVRGKK